MASISYGLFLHNSKMLPNEEGFLCKTYQWGGETRVVLAQKNIKNVDEWEQELKPKCYSTIKRAEQGLIALDAKLVADFEISIRRID